MAENRSDFGVKRVGADARETMRWRNEGLRVLSHGGDRSGDYGNHAVQLIDADRQRWHQHDDVTERPEKKTSPSGLLCHSVADSGFERIGFFCRSVLYQFNSDHETLLSNLSDMRQPTERREQSGQQSDFGAQFPQGLLFPEHFQIG